MLAEDMSCFKRLFGPCNVNQDEETLEAYKFAFKVISVVVDCPEVEFVHAVSAGGSIKFLPAV